MEIPVVNFKGRTAIVLVLAIYGFDLTNNSNLAHAAPAQPETPTLFVDYDDRVLDSYIGASAELTATTNSVSGAARYEWDILDKTVMTTRPSVTRGVSVFGSSTTASVKVRAVDSEGSAGPWSNTSSRSIYSSAPRPKTPAVSFNKEGNTIAISGYKYTNATEYSIKITNPRGGSTRETVTETEYAYAVSLSDPSGTWRVSVQARTATHRTAFSRSAILAVNVPERPVELAAEAGNGQVTLTWKDPNDERITKYQVTVDFGEWRDIEDSHASTTSHTVEQLTNGTEYRFQIRAVSDGGASEASDTVSATPVALPKPTGLEAASDDGQVTLTWDGPGNANIVHYQLRVDRGEWSRMEGSHAGTTSHTVRNLRNGTEYRFQIRAVSVDGVGEASDPVTAFPGSAPELRASTESPLTEATLAGSVVKLILNGRTFERWNSVRNNVTVSGIDGVSFRSTTDVERVSDTEVAVKLSFSGNIDSDTTLVFTAGAGAISGYNGPALTARISVAAVTETLVASTAQPLTEATLNGSVVTLTLGSGTFERWNDVRNNLRVSGIDGVSFRSSTDVERVSDTEVTVKLSFSGNIDSDTTLVFTVGAGAISGYNGSALTAEISVTADHEATPDFDGDGTVGFRDFLLFASVFGTSRGDTEYSARFDLDGDDAVGFSDFLIFAGSFGKDVTSSGGDNGGDGGSGQACNVGMTLGPGEGCQGSGYSFRNDAGVLIGQGNVGGISIENARFSGGSVRLNQLHLTRSGNVWTIVSLP